MHRTERRLVSPLPVWIAQGTPDQFRGPAPRVGDLPRDKLLIAFESRGCTDRDPAVSIPWTPSACHPWWSGCGQASYPPAMPYWGEEWADALQWVWGGVILGENSLPK